MGTAFGLAGILISTSPNLPEVDPVKVVTTLTMALINLAFSAFVTRLFVSPDLEAIINGTSSCRLAV